ncbi:MAG: DUF2867 domain-containing protein [Undibacterium sp.]|nr:DUF2867 domain-containing protein [Undibacterium sp.]
MTAKSYFSDFPVHREISKYLTGAYFFDCYQRDVLTVQSSALELCLGMLESTPRWVNFLMEVRNRVVGWFGLKNLGSLNRHLTNKRQSKPASSYRVGDKVGIFSLLYLSEDEVILGDSDKHLDVRLSLCKNTNESGMSLKIATVVHVHNSLGRAYMAVVAPVHKVIAPAMLSRFEIQ